jgi:rod shape-determining protein MreD
MIGLVLLALRSGPGIGAVAGFLVGLASDALSPARFGAAALANTMVGYFAAQTRAFFFADNLLVNAGFLFRRGMAARPSCWWRAGRPTRGWPHHSW